MGVAILCQIPRAEHPWYLNNIGLNIYSVEELEYFICNNLPLVDESVVCEGFALWVGEELKQPALSRKLLRILDGPYTDIDFVLAFLKESCFMNSKELQALSQQLQELADKPEAVQLKTKADTLVKHEKYSKAIDYYREALLSKEQGNMGSQFAGTIYNNLGCVYARLFLMEEACECFRLSYEYLHTFPVLKRYLFSIFVKDGENVYRQKLEEFGVDEKSRIRLTEEIASVKMPDIPENLDSALQQWTASYHKNTDL